MMIGRVMYYYYYYY